MKKYDYTVIKVFMGIIIGAAGGILMINKVFWFGLVVATCGIYIVIKNILKIV